MVQILIVIMVALGFTLASGRVAEARGRRFGLWAWLGALLGPLALATVALLPSRRHS